MNFTRFLDIQSWWEVPSIAYYCSLFRTAFNLLDFDIEELEEALLTDGTEEPSCSLLTELIVRLLNGCLGNNDISAFNYQMYLRRLFRRKCQNVTLYNPFNTDIDFQFLPLRTKVEILYTLCDYRLDAEDVYDLFKNLEAESLRVEPLGWDDNDSAYWYFYGTRLYREDYISKSGAKSTKKDKKEEKRKRELRKRDWFYGDDWLDDDDTKRVWQVVCFTEEDWTHLTEKFKNATSKVEKELYRSLSQNFLPEIPRLFQEKERLQRKRLLDLAPRRTSSRVLQKIKQRAEETKTSYDSRDEDSKETPTEARNNRAKRRDRLRRSKETPALDSSSDQEEMPQKVTRPSRAREKKSRKSSSSDKGEPPPEPVVKTGRKTNNSLAAATGQIVIPDNDEPVNANTTRRKLKTSQIFSQTEEDIQTDMYKVLEQLAAHENAWPFLDPVEEEYAPNYYAVIRRPMDLHKMEERLDSGYYTDFSMFKADFKLIVNNCRLYNGQDNEYTIMVDSLQNAFDKLTEKYIHNASSSDEEIAVEYQLPTPSRKHKIKATESPICKKRKRLESPSVESLTSPSTSKLPEEKVKEKKKKKKKHRETQEEVVEEPKKEGEQEETKSEDVETNKESHKKHDKGKKKRHHRHGKHSKNHKKNSHKSRESRKHKKHGKNKDKKSKKKKNKHRDVEPPPPPPPPPPSPPPPEPIKRALSQESLESSYRSRSASPLPSIHTPSPSPTELDQSNDQKSNDQVPDTDFLKDKYDKIKERRRTAAKDAWESLFDYKQKVDKQKHISDTPEKDIDKQKHTSDAPEKDKNHKLRETIEKLKAKNEKYKNFNSLFTPGQSDKKTKNKGKRGKKDEGALSDASVESVKVKRKRRKKSSAKNASASVALEQAVKDISKWLSDAPKRTTVISPCPSPAHTISTEEQENSRLDDESSQGEKPILSRKDVSRKRPSSREPKVVKRREIQRTIDRLQPGKSKGNLLTNMNNKNTDKTEENALGSSKCTRESNKAEENGPKLTLGSVLPTVEFNLGHDHNFNNDIVETTDNQKETKKDEPKDTKNDTLVENENVEKTMHPTKKDAEVETDPQTIIKPSQEKATPNLSAWFKAFGAPKTTTTNSNHSKKKTDETDKEEKMTENTNTEKKTSPKNVTVKFDSLNDLNSPNPDGGDSPLPSIIVTPRQRRTSTGSSISERSSFSQDLDSPRHQMSHTSPLLRSPASPRTDDFQKITYPIINGTVRAGFYQDTTSLKSSPEKSCSPRDAPQSPYSPYSQHVYASNNGAGSSTPNYFVDHNKSPLPTYGQNAPPYYDSSKAPVVSKPARVHDDYTALGPDSFQQNNYNGSFSPTPPPFPATQSNYSQPQLSPQPELPTSQPSNAVPLLADPKTSLFPVKKRTYNEPENLLPLKKPDNNEFISSPPKNDYQMVPQSLHSTQVQTTTSVDDIAVALSEKSEILKINTSRDKMGTIDYSERRITETKEHLLYENDIVAHDHKKEADIHHIDLTKSSVTKKDNIDMINMGYLNNEDRKVANESHDVEFVSQTQARAHLNPQQKGYEIEAIAINLGINNHQLSKPLTKPPMIASNMTPAHSHPLDRPHTDVSVGQNIPIAHHNHYDALPTGQSMSTFSLNDIELANKKLYGCNTPVASPALDYGSWKINSMRKSEVMPSDYSATSYTSSNEDKLKPIDSPTPVAINYNKSVQNQQYNNYSSVSRGAIPRNQELQQNLPTEIRVPNLRGLLKCDPVSASGTINECDNVAKNVDTITKSQKAEKHSQNHPLGSSLTYKTSYSSHSTLPIDTLRNLPNIPQMLERYSNDERYLSSFANTAPSLYHDKTFQMFNKTIPSETHPVSTSVSSLYAQQPVAAITKENNTYKAASSIASPQIDAKKNKRKRTSDTKQLYSTPHTATCSSDVLTSVKTTMMPASPFNFGTASNMTLSGMYGENGGFTIEDIRNSTNQLMAANYMAAAVAHQQRSNETNTEKLVKPAHQNSNHSASSFPFIGHSQVRAGYPFVGAEQSSPLYQQYWQRYQEELQRQTGAQIMGLYPSAYSTPLGVRQPYDAINRPSWL